MKHKKIIVVSVIILAITFIVIALSNSTYALFSSDAYGTNTEVYTTGMLLVEASSKSETISLANALPMSDEDGLKSNPYVFTIRNVGNLDYLFDVKLLSTDDSSTSFSPQYIKLQIDDGDVITLSSLTNGEIKSDITLLAGDSIDVSIRVWLSIETPNSEIGKSFNSKIVTDGQAVYTSTNDEYKVNLIYHISNLYKNANKTVITNNSINYNQANIYNIDDDDTTSGGLMNDRLGGTTREYDAGNIRYYGANPNNYIDIGDVYEEDIVVKNWEEPMRQMGVSDSLIPTNSDSCKYMAQCSVLVSGGFFESVSVCEAKFPYMIQSFGYSSIDEVCSTTTIPAGTTKSLYRIIGLFKNVELSDGTTKNLIKVIRDISIADFSWDQSPSDVNNGEGINEWSQADLMKLLNPGYTSETVGGSLYWNSMSGNCYGYVSNNDEYTNIPCDFTNKGLNSDVHSKIEEVKWNIGGWTDIDYIYSNQFYENERGETVYQIGSHSLYNDTIERKTVWTGNVALAYPSDYGYSADLNSCNKWLYEYNDSSCTENNWMYNTLTINGVNISWLLTPYSFDASGAWYVRSTGEVYPNPARKGFGVFPVFYLDPGLGIVSGDGSESNPFVVQ